MKGAYITSSSQRLPGDPVSNEDMTRYIGSVSPSSDRIGRLMLRRNRIRGRHYAIREDGTSSWSTAGLGAAAVRDLVEASGISIPRIGFLASATTQNDLMVPGLASGIHAESGLPPMEIASLQSVCASSMMALKSAALQVAVGEHAAAIAVGAEFSSRYFRPEHYAMTVDAEGRLPDDAEFLRWTLSDGAAAVLIEAAPPKGRLSLRIDWIELRSFADRFDTCMTAGGVAGADGRIPWSMMPGAVAAAQAGAFQLRQDVESLHRMLPVWMGEFMRLVDAGRICPSDTDWFLCHFSAHSLRVEMERMAERAGCMIPRDRWFTNIYEKGNVGSASIFLLLDDLLKSGDLVKGQRIVCAVPESGRCVMAHAGMTVVDGEES